MEPTTPSTPEHDGLIAQVGWAVFILSYLTNKRSQVELLRCDADKDEEEEEEEEDHEHGDLDAETERTVVLQGPRDSVRSKFLDCIAQLLSPSKGWDNVCATALREREDFVAIDVARNDCFGMASSGSADEQVCTFEGYEAEYCSEMTNYLSMTQQGGIILLFVFNDYLRSSYRIVECIRTSRYSLCR